MWCTKWLEYSVPFSEEVTTEEATDAVSLVSFVELFAKNEELCWGFEFAGRWPCSASFLRRSMTVGRNLVDIESIPGSCMQNKKKWRKNENKLDKKWEKSIDRNYDSHYESYIISSNPVALKWLWDHSQSTKNKENNLIHELLRPTEWIYRKMNHWKAPST